MSWFIFIVNIPQKLTTGYFRFFHCLFSWFWIAIMKSTLFLVCLAALAVIATAEPSYKETVEILFNNYTVLLKQLYNLTQLVDTASTPLCPAFCRPQGVYFLPHFQRCNSYYRCTHGFLLEFDCPDYTQFDVVTLSCTDYGLSRCILAGPPGEIGIGR